MLITSATIHPEELKKNLTDRGAGAYVSFEGWIRKIMVRESISFLRQFKELQFQEDDEFGGSQPYRKPNHWLWSCASQGDEKFE